MSACTLTERSEVDQTEVSCHLVSPTSFHRFSGRGQPCRTVSEMVVSHEKTRSKRGIETTTPQGLKPGIARVTNPQEWVQKYEGGFKILLSTWCLSRLGRKSLYASWKVRFPIRRREREIMFLLDCTGCNRLFPSKERVMAHRKRDHGSEEEGEIVSWNL